MRNTHEMAVRPPSLRAIAAFEAAARLQSFTKAAAELNLTDGAISHSVRGLEARLGDTLFERSGRGVQLTEAGRVLAGRVRLSLGLLSDAFEVKPWLSRKTLTVTTVPAFAALVLAPRFSSFREAFPDVRLELISTSTLLSSDVGYFDVAIRYGQGNWPGLQAAKLLDDWVFPVIAPSFEPWPEQPADLLSMPLIGWTELPWKRWLDAAGVAHEPPKPLIVVDQAMVALEAAASGYGVALTTSTRAHSYIQAGRLRRLFDTTLLSDYCFWTAWSPTSPKAELIEKFVGWLGESIAGVTFDPPLPQA